MSSQIVVVLAEATGITTTSPAFVLDPAKTASVGAILTAGTPLTGARLEVTVDDALKIQNGTAAWVPSPMGPRVESGIETLHGALSGVRLQVTDGTWTLQVRQA